MPGRAGQGLWRDERKDLVREVPPQRFLLRRGQLVPPENGNAVLRERRPADLAETAGLPLQQRAHTDRDGVEQLLRRRSVRASQRRSPAARALQRGHAYHEELVEVRAQDRQEPDAGEQGYAGIIRQILHARVELDEAEIAVQKMIRTGPIEIGERGAQREVGQAHSSLAAAGQRRRGERGAGRPLRERVRPCGHGEGGEGARIAQGRRARAGEQLAQRQPLQTAVAVGIPRAGDPAGQPDLEDRPRGPRGRRTEQADLAVRTPEMRAQNLATRILAVAAPDRQREGARVREHRHASLRHDDHRHLVAAARHLRQVFAFEIAEQLLGAIHFSHEQPTQAVPLLQRPRDTIHPGLPGGELSQLQLLKRPCQPPTADGHDVVHDLVARAREPSGIGVPPASLCFERDAGHEQGRLDECTQAARRVGHAPECLLPFQFRDVRFERLGHHERRAALPPADGAQGEDAPVVDAGTEPARDATTAQGPVGRIEVDVPLKRLLDRTGADSQRERLRHHAVQELQRGDLALPLGGHG